MRKYLVLEHKTYGGRVLALSHNVRVSLWAPSPLPSRGMGPRPDGKLALGWWPALVEL
jgi:hypothetical protein